MGVIVHKENDRDTELNRRISADLRNKIQSQSMSDDPDLAEDSDYVKDLKKTGKFGWVWAVLIGGAIISLILIFTF